MEPKSFNQLAIVTFSHIVTGNRDSGPIRRIRFAQSLGWRLLLLIFFLIPSQLSHAAHPLEEWHQRAPLPTSSQLQDIASGEGKQVVVFADPAGRALVSNDGLNFEAQPLNLPASVLATRILYGNGRWLVMAGGRVWSKVSWVDAWTEGNSVPHGFAEMRSLGGAFWAWSAGGFFPNPLAWRTSVLYRSTDGLIWNAVPISGVATDRFAITDMLFAAGTFVITNAGYPSPGGIWTSTDGIVWTAVMHTGSLHYSITYGNGRFVAGAGNGLISISTDAVTWSSAQFPFVAYYLTNWQPGSSSPVYSEAREVVFSNGKFVALAQGNFGSALLAESSDGVTWESVSEDDADFVRSAAVKLKQIGDQTYLLGLNGNLWRTSLWKTSRAKILPLESWDWSSIAASTTRLVVAGEAGRVVWSDDAVTFHPVHLPDAADVLDLIWAPELAVFVAVGGDITSGRVWTSPDGVAWTSQILPGFIGGAAGVAWDGSQLVICGDGGRMAASVNGVHWTPRESGTTESLTAIEWGGGNFVATGSGGIVIHSMNGISWTRYQLGPDTVTYRGLAYGNGLWIVPDGYEIHITENLEHWWKSPGQASGRNSLYAFGEFITADHRAVLATSNASFWQTYVDGYAPGTNYPIGAGYTRGIRFGNRVVFAGNDGHIGASGVWRNFFREWQVSKFTGEELLLPNISGPNSDPDFDGWSNLFEYAFDLNPKTREIAGNSSSTTYLAKNENYFSGTMATYTHPWAAKRPGVSIWPERSRDLVKWTREGLTSDYRYHVGMRKMAQTTRLPIRSPSPEFIRLRAVIVEP